VPAVPRREDGKGDLPAPADHGRGERLYRVSVGVQRQALRAQRGRRHVRDAGGAGGQGGQEETAPGEGARDAGDRRRFVDRENRFQAVPHQQQEIVNRLSIGGSCGSCLLYATWLVCSAAVAAQGLSMEMVGLIEGPADVVRVNGSFAYVAAGQSLTV